MVNTKFLLIIGILIISLVGSFIVYTNYNSNVGRLYSNKQALCMDFAQSYLKTIPKVEPEFNDQKWQMAVDIETELYNLCLTDLNPQAIRNFYSKALEKYQEITPIETTKTMSITGEYTCLPHKNTSGPQTLECALGIKGNDGNYYSLDTNQIGMESVISIPTGSTIQVDGTFTPVEALSSDHWQKYNIRGIITVTSLEQK